MKSKKRLKRPTPATIMLHQRTKAGWSLITGRSGDTLLVSPNKKRQLKINPEIIAAAERRGLILGYREAA